MSEKEGFHYTTLATFTGSFSVIGEDGNRFSAQWEFQPTRPTKRQAGIGGWATFCSKGAQRLHFCAQKPCAAKWPASTYGALPAPTHGLLAPLGFVSVGSAETAAGTPAAPPVNALPATGNAEIQRQRSAEDSIRNTKSLSDVRGGGGIRGG